MRDVLAMLHLIVLALWGGVVATEAVIELAPFKQRDLHVAAIRLHTWIDLLVELPLVLAVVASGSALLLVIDEVTPRHLLKLGCAGLAVTVNLFCIAVVLVRGRRLVRGHDEASLWRASRTVLACFALGLAAAAGAAALGLGFALARVG